MKKQTKETNFHSIVYDRIVQLEFLRFERSFQRDSSTYYSKDWRKDDICCVAYVAIDGLWKARRYSGNTKTRSY